MGSLEEAIMTGFICRLCSKMNKCVIHMYGDEGRRLKLVSKIKEYLPVKIDAKDPLPKTICKECIFRLQCHHKLMRKITQVRKSISENAFQNELTESRRIPSATQSGQYELPIHESVSAPGRDTIDRPPPIMRGVNSIEQYAPNLSHENTRSSAVRRETVRSQDAITSRREGSMQNTNQRRRVELMETNSENSQPQHSSYNRPEFLQEHVQVFRREGTPPSHTYIES